MIRINIEAWGMQGTGKTQILNKLQDLLEAEGYECQHLADMHRIVAIKGAPKNQLSFEKIAEGRNEK
jgi:hypothetical protein